MIALPYQKLQIWQKGIELAEMSYKLSEKLPQKELYGLISQIRRAASSIPANIAEGSQRNGKKEFSQFLLIAKGSLAELETHFILSEKLGYISKDSLDQIMGKTQELSKMMYVFRKKLTSDF